MRLNHSLRTNSVWTCLCCLTAPKHTKNVAMNFNLAFCLLYLLSLLFFSFFWEQCLITNHSMFISKSNCHCFMVISGKYYTKNMYTFCISNRYSSFRLVALFSLRLLLYLFFLKKKICYNSFRSHSSLLSFCNSTLNHTRDAICSRFHVHWTYWKMTHLS